MSSATRESRRHKRYKVQEKVIALSFNDICRIMDISVGGAAIKCLGRSDLPPSWSLDILMVDEKFHATIPVKLAWEKEVQFSPVSSIFTKCVGVQFDNLTRENKKKIEYLIRLHEEYAA